MKTKNNLSTIGIIGAGTMGTALAQKLAQEDFGVIITDKDSHILHYSLEKIKHSLQEAVNRHIIPKDKISEILFKIKGTSSLYDLNHCDIVIEAVNENFEIKKDLFLQLNEILNDTIVIVTNTSSYSVTDFSKCFVLPGRFVGMHFFYHPSKNRLVEVIILPDTPEWVIKKIQVFTLKAGKDPIYCKDSPGFAANRFFVPWLNESVRMLEEKIATPEEIENVSKNLFGVGMGPFTLMNATGLQVGLRAQKNLEKLGNLYKVAPLWEKRVVNGNNWILNESATSETDPVLDQKISDRLLGLLFYICAEIQNEKICSPSELNLIAKTGFKWQMGPVDLFHKIGVQKTKDLIKETALRYGVKIPQNFPVSEYNIEYVHSNKIKQAGILFFVRPDEMNSLCYEMLTELDEKFTTLLNDREVQYIILTGIGKAFATDTDEKYLSKKIYNIQVNSIGEFSAYKQLVLSKIDQSPKPVTAVLNGMALGAGLELALCCDRILTYEKAFMAFPFNSDNAIWSESGIKRISERLTQGLSKYMIYTGDTVNAVNALQMGLIDGLIDGDEYIEILKGKVKPDLYNKPHKPEDETIWKLIGQFFEDNTLDMIFRKQYKSGHLSLHNVHKLISYLQNKSQDSLLKFEKIIDRVKDRPAVLQL